MIYSNYELKYPHYSQATSGQPISPRRRVHFADRPKVIEIESRRIPDTPTRQSTTPSQQLGTPPFQPNTPLFQQTTLSIQSTTPPIRSPIPQHNETAPSLYRTTPPYQQNTPPRPPGEWLHEHQLYEVQWPLDEPARRDTVLISCQPQLCRVNVKAVSGARRQATPPLATPPSANPASAAPPFKRTPFTCSITKRPIYAETGARAATHATARHAYSSSDDPLTRNQPVLPLPLVRSLPRRRYSVDVSPGHRG